MGVPEYFFCGEAVAGQPAGRARDRVGLDCSAGPDKTVRGCLSRQTDHPQAATRSLDVRGRRMTGRNHSPTR
eukprot:9677022-Alexandrium_andersonii.AAC.1